jgi:hypothetical protein
MRYLLFICDDEKWLGSRPPEQLSELLADYAAFGEEMGKRGVLQGGERLRDTTDATTVRVKDGEVLTSDGPFAETKEQIGGFCVIECADMAAAVEAAARHPAAGYGTIEVRPMLPS